MHLMFDIETLGVVPGYAVVTLGYTLFELDKKYSYEQLLENSYLLNFNLEEQQKLGMLVDLSTVKWWMQQSKDAIDNTFSNSYRYGDLETSLKFFNGKCSIADGVWTFGYMDIAMTNYLFYKAGMNGIFYRKHRDMRTITSLYNKEWPVQPEGFIGHDARHDACYQAYVLQRILND